jgi:hypothetical protein
MNSLSYTECGRLHGPVDAVPENYVPETIITDAEFDAIYEKRENVTVEERFLSRDYVIEVFHECSREGFERGTSTMDALSDLSKARLDALFWGLASCTCCWRHCHNTPVKVDSLVDKSALEVATKEMVSERHCHCYCRMAKRMIRRVYLDAGSDAKATADVSDTDTLPYSDTESEE